MYRPNYVELRKCIDLLKWNTFKIRHLWVKLSNRDSTDQTAHAYHSAGENIQGTRRVLSRLHRMMGADRSFVTVGRSLTVAKGFSPLRKGGFAIPSASLGDVASGLDASALKVVVLLETSALLSAAARMDRHSK